MAGPTGSVTQALVTGAPPERLPDLIRTVRQVSSRGAARCIAASRLRVGRSNTGPDFTITGPRNGGDLRAVPTVRTACTKTCRKPGRAVIKVRAQTTALH
jgi:hypothetical protein